MVEMLERFVSAVETLAKASAIQADLMAKMSYPALAPEAPTNGEAKTRTRRTKAEIEAEKAAAVRETQTPELEEKKEPEKVYTAPDLNDILKKLVAKDNGNRDRALGILQKHGDGRLKVLDIDPAKYAAIYRDAERAING